MCDESIRRVSIAELAAAAARRQIDTGTSEPNPFEGTPDAPVYLIALGRYLSELSCMPDSEGGA